MSTKNDKEIIKVLKSIPIFQGLDDEEYGKFIPYLELLSFPTDTRIINEGTTGESMFILITGTVKVTKTEKNNEEIFLQALYAGSYFGELSLIDNMPRSANVTTISETEIFKLEKSNFDKLLSENIKMANLFYKNFLEETFSRFRHIVSNFTFSQHVLHEKSTILDELNKDLSYAKQIQNYFINTENLNFENSLLDGVKHSYIYDPCIEIGGDFLNLITLKGNKNGFIIADVMGHGITAALGTGVLKSALSIYADEHGDNPIELMGLLNNHFFMVIPQLYATCYYALIDLDKKIITMAKAGHHHPFFWKKKNSDLITIDCIGTGLGLMQDAQFGKVQIDFEKGDKILFFTDGIIEQVNKNNEMYSKSRLGEIFKELIIQNKKDILKEILDDLKAYSEDIPADDDITLFLLEF